MADTLDSSLPQADRYRFSVTSDNKPDWSYNISCTVDGDKKELLQLTAKMGVEMPWREWEKNHVPPRSGETSYFNAGIKGVSGPALAVIDVPCYTHESSSGQPHNLTVTALAFKPMQGSDKQIRQDFVDLALDFARASHKDAKCDRPSQLPAKVAAPSE
ncbi:hypothetical protein G3I19_25615 [Streptomyces sp. SID10853]|uniref:hypothetical protein n=1 Tax=Streptomyces sp. SID10853 TaxID=2706028 RepID=UPI0013C0C1C9|nr:hypothetical protein [Streptomyces sp. SID10853]NDZ81851.1 hypothetical protein [Streptomyces sp. SID10853]